MKEVFHFVDPYTVASDMCMMLNRDNIYSRLLCLYFIVNILIYNHIIVLCNLTTLTHTVSS